MAKHATSTESKILKRIRTRGREWVFTPVHFAGLGTRDAIDSTLKRLTTTGVIRRVARGIYDYPVHDPLLGIIAPSTDAIARAVTQRHAIRIQPSGAYAANILGLCEQVPSRIVFLTDGPSRKIRLGKRFILFRKTVPRNIATAGRVSGTIIQAVRYLGRDAIDKRVLFILRRNIKSADYSILQEDLRYAPDWVGKVLRPLLDSSCKS